MRSILEKDDLEGLVILLVFVLLVGRGVYIVHRAGNLSCPKGQTVAIDVLAVPIFQDAVSCEQSP